MLDRPPSDLPFELRFEYANENRQATINLGGMGVTILTFLLIFLYDRFSTGGIDQALFQVTLGAVVVSIFFLGVAGTYYYLLLEALERGAGPRARLLAIADASFVIGLALLLLEPALILITLGIYDVGTLAVVLWAVSLFLIARGRTQLGGAPKLSAG
ncbi:MAG TPA: hypothetical protein VML53_05085 [Thermoplasmata archaeon]|nr:hypothetical protein [Thermoplasmata archaeon]